ncbi:tRNA (adenosine(37)-N6)-threonylcarbamoyltransferase complex ATPase subunit type 1 TsaE [Vagococcus acidifermentans]|uniref:tRNA threonylcarbamoyladenosine biosynthesis protein TsaE n=1 Tax=Vagococcus acidifermentans TaxID=564710 RepID=A0A430AUK2_9ENTE|nr:tRNA (adenosine(37)-N6)-threonylcarbamoyltransferase complex ATPase subunit type 1 TsaE [Vagococcus acidifermentans]RSU11738.1 tRNA (adenosine(37)-N6)-threonylcarbamoyltransferase complex ATPase subunit type 1 TsaE [Vagococcus acidifermentans]
MELIVQGEQETLSFGKKLGQFAQAGDVFILTGDLGAGKTTLTKGFAAGLGITQMIKSPTYTLIREYDTGRLPLYHMDVYRLSDGADELGLEEYFEGEGVCVVEWGELIRDMIDVPYIELTLQKIAGDDEQRAIKLTTPDDHLRQRLAAFLENKENT